MTLDMSHISLAAAQQYLLNICDLEQGQFLGLPPCREEASQQIIDCCNSSRFSSSSSSLISSLQSCSQEDMESLPKWTALLLSTSVNANSVDGKSILHTIVHSILLSSLLFLYLSV
jgi:hypothetical protein